LPVRSIVNGVEGDIITFNAGDLEDAQSKIQRYVDDFNLSGQASDYDVRSVLTPPAHTTRSSGEMELYNIRKISTDLIVSAFRVPNHAAAIQKFQDFLMRHGGNSNDFRLERADANGESHRETPRAGRNYEIFRGMDRTDIVAAFVAVDDQEAMARLERYRREHPGREYNAQRAPEQPTAQPTAQTTSNDSEWQRQQQSYRTARNWEVYNHNDVNTVVRTLNDMSSEQVLAALPAIETELNLPTGSLRVRTI
jgi:hypothetical protein